MDMASRSGSRAPDTRNASEEDSSLFGNALTAVSGTNISTFSRKVTTTAGSLISPFSDTLAPGGHYHNTMAEISKDLRRPSLQRRMFSFSNTTPSEIVRSKLSTAEIQYRALTYLPDELLKDIPATGNQYSLFQGFQASIEMPTNRKHKRRKSDPKYLIDSSDGGQSGVGSITLAKLTRERNNLSRQLDLFAVRKSIASSEIKEIDNKVANLNTMRALILEKLARLEQEESQLEHELLDLDNRIDDLDYEHVPEEGAASPLNAEDDTQFSESGSLMTESVYGRLSSPKSRKPRVPSKRRSMPILHEHMAPGSNIKQFQSHVDAITCLDFDFPFGTMVTAALDDTVRVWDLNTSRCLGLLEGHNASVRCVQVEDNLVATGSMDATIRLWDLSRADHSAPPVVAEPIPTEGDSELSDNGGQERQTAPQEVVQQSSVGPDSHLITLEAHVGEVTALYFQNNTLVSGSADKTLRQWDLETGRCVQTLDVLWAASQTMSFSAEGDDSKWHGGGAGRSHGRIPGQDSHKADFVGALQCFDAALACGTADGLVRLWDLRSGQVHRSLFGHTGPITALQFDDVHLVTGSADRSIRIWDLRTGSIFDAYAYEHPITSMQFDPRRIVSAAGEIVAKVYDKAEGRHWDCGPGAVPSSEAEAPTSTALIERVRCKEGYLIEGRRDGMVGVWTC